MNSCMQAHTLNQDMAHLQNNQSVTDSSKTDSY